MSTFRIGITPDWGGQTHEIIGSALEEIFGSLPGVEHEMMQPTDGVAKPEIIDQYDAMIVFGYAYPASSFEGLKRLACIARWGVGYDRIDAPACTAAGVALAITPEGIRRTVSEGILAFIFALAKNMPALDKRVREGRWRDDLECNSTCVEGRTLGSVGVGNIAGELFKMARGIGFGRLIGYDPYASPDRAKQMGVELVDLPTVMRESDYVCINTLLNEETKGLIGAKELAMMKPTAFFINTARGPIVDEDALIEVLRNRRIAGAGLDVFREEPPPKDNPLFKMDNVILAPHSIAWTIEGLAGNSLEACKNIRRIYEGEAPLYLANPKVRENPIFLERLARRKS
jgi:phosphoglycerate dehydrogenase-like enzyme